MTRIPIPPLPYIPGWGPIVPLGSLGSWDSFAQTQGPSQDPGYTPGTSSGAGPSTSPFTSNNYDDDDDDTD